MDIEQIIDDLATQSEATDPSFTFLNGAPTHTQLVKTTLKKYTQLLDTQVKMHMLETTRDNLDAECTKAILFMSHTNDNPIVHQLTAQLSATIQPMLAQISSNIQTNKPPSKRTVAQIHVYLDSPHINLNDSLELAAANIYCLLQTTNTEDHCNQKLTQAIRMYKQHFVKNKYEHAKLIVDIKTHKPNAYNLICKQL